MLNIFCANSTDDDGMKHYFVNLIILNKNLIFCKKVIILYLDKHF